MVDKTFARQVDRRLSAATILVGLLGDKTKHINPLEKNAFIESVLLQLYFAVISYLNELLTYHQRDTIDLSKINLINLLNQSSSFFDGVNEFYLLKEWSNKNSGVLERLAQLPKILTSLMDENTQRDNGNVNKNNDIPSQSSAHLPRSDLHLISVNNIDELGLLNTTDYDLYNVVQLKNTIVSFQSFIESQRILHVEY